nr:MAG TPA: Receptor Binding Protein [Caudoviricetes sp.]
MAYTSGFFDAVDQGGGDYDRVYSASSFAHYFSLLVKNGVFPDPSTGMQVKASSNPDMHVSVQPGSGWINGYYITVEDNVPEQLTVPTANSSLSRIDSVIMGLNYVDRKIQLYIKSGAVSASPSSVSLQRDKDLYELELAQIIVSAGMASISQSSIIDMRQNTSRCGIVAGTIDQIDTEGLFAQYDDAFQTWFEGIKSNLSGNVATNLQKQITALENNKVNVSDKASTTQAQAGTDDTKWMTPAKVKSWWDKLYGTLLLSVAKGGTGKSSWSANRLIYPSAATTLAQLAFPSQAGAFLKQNPSGAPYWGYPSEAGTYGGQGRTGKSSPNTITFVNGVPKVVFIKKTKWGLVEWGLLIITPSASTGFSQIDGTMSDLVVSISGNTVSWYLDSTTSHPANQLDTKGGTYSYVGIF